MNWKNVPSGFDSPLYLVHIIDAKPFRSTPTSRSVYQQEPAVLQHILFDPLVNARQSSYRSFDYKLSSMSIG